MNWKRLLSLTKDESLENLRRNRLVCRIAKEAIQNFITEGEDINNTYEAAFPIWDRDRKEYLLVAKDSDGIITIGFPDENHAAILKGDDNDFVIEVLIDETVAMLQQCIAIVDGRAKELETNLACEYLKDVRFGTIVYLEDEFKTFVKNRLDQLSNLRGKDIYKHMPLKFNYKGRLVEYLKEYGANVTNLHIINS